MMKNDLYRIEKIRKSEYLKNLHKTILFKFTLKVT